MFQRVLISYLRLLVRRSLINKLYLFEAWFCKFMFFMIGADLFSIPIEPAFILEGFPA